MDKQQATTHIQTRLQAGYSPEEIVDDLSLILKASPEKVRPFVDQVAASYSGTVPQTPSFLDEDQPEVSENASLQVDLSESPQQVSLTDLPPGLQALLNEGAPPTGVSLSQSVEPVPNPETGSPSGMQLLQKARFETTSDKANTSNINLDALNEKVLQQLKKQRRHNDIVEVVCHETGWHWNKSQRFVARIQTKHHDELQAGKNRTRLIVSIGIMFAGLIITLNGASIISDYAKLVSFARTNPEALLDVSPAVVFFALSATATGIGMMLGGGYGIARIVTNR